MDKTGYSSEMMAAYAQQQRELQRGASKNGRTWQVPVPPAEGLSFDDFLDKQEIGKGKDSKIYACKCSKIAAHTVVVKAYDKSKVTDVKIRSIKREARMMNYLTLQQVPSITAFITAFQDEERMYIVMEHCTGGDLLEQLLKEGRAMRERRVVLEVALPLLQTLRHMHALGIIHRDIKLENIFVDEAKRIKLGDFGLAMSMQEERAISPVGTLEYMAPETVKLPPAEMIIKGKIKPEDVESVNEKVDIWALGVTIFELVTGRSPFEGDDKAKVKKAILEGNMRAMPGFVSADCADFITRMMQYDVRLRPSAEELLQHPWLLKNAPVLPTPLAGSAISHSCPASPRTSFQTAPVMPARPSQPQPQSMPTQPSTGNPTYSTHYQPQPSQASQAPFTQAVDPTASPLRLSMEAVSAIGLVGSHNPNAYTYLSQGGPTQQYSLQTSSLPIQQYSNTTGQYTAAAGSSFSSSTGANQIPSRVVNSFTGMNTNQMSSSQFLGPAQIPNGNVNQLANMGTMQYPSTGPMQFSSSGVALVSIPSKQQLSSGVTNPFSNQVVFAGVNQYSGASNNNQYISPNAAASADASRMSSRLSNASPAVAVMAYPTPGSGVSFEASQGMLQTDRGTGAKRYPDGIMQDGAGAMDMIGAYNGGNGQLSSRDRDPVSGASSPRTKRKLKQQLSNSARPASPSTAGTSLEASNIFERMSQFFSKRLLRKERGGSSGISSPHEMGIDDSSMESAQVAAKVEHLFMSGMNGDGSITQPGSFVLKVPSVTQQGAGVYRQPF